MDRERFQSTEALAACKSPAGAETVPRRILCPCLGSDPCCLSPAHCSSLPVTLHRPSNRSRSSVYTAMMMCLISLGRKMPSPCYNKCSPTSGSCWLPRFHLGAHLRSAILQHEKASDFPGMFCSSPVCLCCCYFLCQELDFILS